MVDGEDQWLTFLNVWILFALTVPNKYGRFLCIRGSGSGSIVAKPLAGITATGGECAGGRYGLESLFLKLSRDGASAMFASRLFHSLMVLG